LITQISAGTSSIALLDCKIIYPDGASETGDFFLSSLSRTGEYNGAVTFEAQLLNASASGNFDGFFYLSGIYGYADLSDNALTVTNSGTANTSEKFVFTAGDSIACGAADSFKFPATTGIITVKFKFKLTAYDSGWGLIAASTGTNTEQGFYCAAAQTGGSGSQGSWNAESLRIHIWSGDGSTSPAICGYTTPTGSIELNTEYEVVLALDIASGDKFCSINGSEVVLTGVEDAARIDAGATTRPLYLGPGIGTLSDFIGELDYLQVWETYDPDV